MGDIYHGLRRTTATTAAAPARPRRQEAEDQSFDPGLHTVAEVLAYMEANPDDAPRVRSVEQNNRNRKSIVG